MREVDVLIADGGPAGLSAALMLGRSLRSVLVCDGNEARNAATHASHSFFTRDGTPPLELRQIGRDQLDLYETVQQQSTTVETLVQDGEYFLASLADGSAVRARAVVLATGVRDELPPISGVSDIWGTSAFSCPYCDGWEVRGRKLGLYPRGEINIEWVVLFRQLSEDVVILTDGMPIGDDERGSLEQLGVVSREEPIARVESSGGKLASVIFANGSVLPREALFLRTTMHPRNDLAKQAGCDLDDEPHMPGRILADAMGQTTVAGVFAAGDVATLMHQVAIAASTGATAGGMANHWLVRQSIEARTRLSIPA